MKWFALICLIFSLTIPVVAEENYAQPQDYGIAYDFDPPTPSPDEGEQPTREELNFLKEIDENFILRKFLAIYHCIEPVVDEVSENETEIVKVSPEDGELNGSPEHKSLLGSLGKLSKGFKGGFGKLGNKVKGGFGKLGNKIKGGKNGFGKGIFGKGNKGFGFGGSGKKGGIGKGGKNRGFGRGGKGGKGGKGKHGGSGGCPSGRKGKRCRRRERKNCKHALVNGECKKRGFGGRIKDKLKEQFDGFGGGNDDTTGDYGQSDSGDYDNSYDDDNGDDSSEDYNGDEDSDGNYADDGFEINIPDIVI